MCGIIGYSGNKNAGETIIKGLHALEYRGYDSAGMSVCENDTVTTIKCKGRVSQLENLYKNNKTAGYCGIGHTRWATHGEPSEKNAHPHESSGCVIVHNGIIENYISLRKKLTEEGYYFKSETDSECIAHLIDKLYKACKQPVKTLIDVQKRLEGSYAVAVIFKDRKDEIWAIKRNNPLVATKNEDGTYIASDIPALMSYSDEFIRPDDNEILSLNKNSIILFDRSGNKKEAEFEKAGWNNETAQKDGYKHFMLKEIYEQPDAIKRAITPLITDNMLPDYDKLNITKEQAQVIDNISIIGCGSATHAGLVAKHVIEKTAKIPVFVTTASEYKYSAPITAGNTLTVAVSQSGETADTLSALRIAKQNGDKTLGIVNVVGSAIAKEVDSVIYTNAGPEIAVATTKGYTTQLAVFYMLAIAIALSKSLLTERQAQSYLKTIKEDIPDKIIEILNYRDKIIDISSKLVKCQHLYFIGRGLDMHSCVECSLKLKEISYIHSEAYAAGELKHGTLSLIEKGTPVIAVCTDTEYEKKMTANIKEVTSRGGYLIYLSNAQADRELYDKIFVLPETDRMFYPFLTAVFGQILSYETALLRGCDVDHPRNLAKSVTVE